MVKNTVYYSLEEIKKRKDLDKKKPTFYLISYNRSAGKTMAVLIECLQTVKKKRKFILLYRCNYELSGCAMIFDDVLKIYPEYGKEIYAQPIARGLFYEIFLDKESVGFSLSLNNPDALKKYSPVFAEVDVILFDEFITESGKYVKNEIQNLQSILLTIARGGGKQSRDISVYMLANRVTIMNPYFIEFGIYNRLRDDTKFMRGHGWVAEFGYNESASEAIKENGISRAFKTRYLQSMTESVYLHESEMFVDSVSGRSKYLCTILYDNKSYGIRDYYDKGILYITSKSDKSCTTILAFRASDHNQVTQMISHYSYTWQFIKESFQNGMLRFDNLKTKSIIFDILAIDLYK